MSVYVGIDVHRKRSQVAVVDRGRQGAAEQDHGQRDRADAAADRRSACWHAGGVRGRVRLGLAARPLEDYGFDPHLVHPLQCKAIASARLKNDKVDAAILAQLLRADLLPEAWIAPPEVRQLRALLRHRTSLVRLGTQLRNRIHAVAGRPRLRPVRPATGPGRAAAGWPNWTCPPLSREIVSRLPGGDRRRWRR